MSRVVVNEIEAKVGNDISFNDTVKIDTIKGKTTAGSILVTGEGNSTTTNLQQGLAKCWINFEGDGTIAISDSLNVSGITDRGTGNYTIAINNDMANATYSVTGSGTHDAGSYFAICVISHDTGLTAGSCPTDYLDNAATARDVELACTTIHGDLA